MFVVTGATGRTGSAVTDRLLLQGKAVRAISRMASRLSWLTDRGAQPFVAEPTDRARLAEAFAGADGAYVMVQPNYIPASPDFAAHQRAIVDAMVGALDDAGVSRIVTLSSWGADKATGTGPVLGLHHLEAAVNALGASVTHLRAGYFMENLLGQVPSIRYRRSVVTPFDPDVAMPFVAALDVGHAAAQQLLAPAPPPGNPEIVEIQGERDLTMREITRVISQLSGIEHLSYAQQSTDDFAAEQRANGVSESVTAMMVDVANAINSGHTR